MTRCWSVTCARALGVIAQFEEQCRDAACVRGRACYNALLLLQCCTHALGVIAQFQPQRSAVMQRARARQDMLQRCAMRARALGVIAQFEIERTYARPRMLQRAAAAAVLHVRAGRHCSVSSMHACPHGRG